jgi:hypothetical protein
MKFGNLDNLSFGMGLVAKPNQIIPAKYAKFDGLDGSASQNISPLLVIIGIILLARLL